MSVLGNGKSRCRRHKTGSPVGRATGRVCARSPVRHHLPPPPRAMSRPFATLGCRIMSHYVNVLRYSPSPAVNEQVFAARGRFLLGFEDAQCFPYYLPPRASTCALPTQNVGQGYPPKNRDSSGKIRCRCHAAPLALPQKNGQGSSGSSPGRCLRRPAGRLKTGTFLVPTPSRLAHKAARSGPIFRNYVAVSTRLLGYSAAQNLPYPKSRYTIKTISRTPPMPIPPP